MSSIFILATDKLTSVLSKLVIIQQKIDLPLNPFDKITYRHLKDYFLCVSNT